MAYLRQKSNNNYSFLNYYLSHLKIGCFQGYYSKLFPCIATAFMPINSKKTSLYRIYDTYPGKHLRNQS